MADMLGVVEPLFPFLIGRLRARSELLFKRHFAILNCCCQLIFTLLIFKSVLVLFLKKEGPKSAYLLFIASENKKICNINETNCRISLDKIVNNGTKWDLVGLCEM